MLNAKEAREYAIKNLSRIKTFTQPEDFLLKYFEERIKENSEKGLCELRNAWFPEDRYKPHTFQRVVNDLKASGFKVDMHVDNAYQKVFINVNW